MNAFEYESFADFCL
jgi:serine/threonine protein kinase